MTNEQLLEAYTKLTAFREGSPIDHPLLAGLAEHARALQVGAEESGTGSGLLGDCLHEIAKSPILFAAALCQWLTADADLPLGKALAHQASVHQMNHAQPQSYDLSALDEHQAVLAACRLCAMVTAPSASLGWALSLARDFPQSTLVSQAVESLLIYHRREIPVTTQRMLCSEGSVFNELPAAISLLSTLEQEEAALDEFPHLRELEMDVEMRSLFSSFKRNEQREIHRRSNEMSVFSQFMTQHHLKYATRTTIEMIGSNSVQETPLSMSFLSFSIEVPLTETIDSTLGRAQRARFWRGVPS